MSSPTNEREIMSFAKYLSELKGKTIAEVTSLTPEEIEDMMWICSPDETILIKFTDGTAAVVMSDPEGNDAGWLEMVELV